MNYFDDIAIGDRRELGSFTFTPDLIKAFARQFDPQPFHLDEEAARNSHFGGLAASGWHVAAVYMKLTVRHFQQQARERERRGEPMIAAGPSPGFRDLKWLRPVLAGDTLSYVSQVSDKRPLATRPEWGLLLFANTAVNQRGELAFSFQGSVFAARRPAGDRSPT